MAIQFIEGFEGYGNAIDLGLIFQSTSNVSIGTGPYGGRALVYSGSNPTPIFLPLITNSTSIYTGFHMIQTNTGVANDYYCIRFNDVGNSTPQITVTFNNSATSGANGIQVFRGDNGVNQIGSSNNFFMQPNVWYYVEIYCAISSSSGTVTININGNQIYTVTGVNTQGGTTGNIAGIGFKVNGTMSIDDMYVLDSTTSKNNTFLCPSNGDLSIVRPVLSSNVLANWSSASNGTVSTNPQFQQVSNVPLQYDASYITATTAGAEDSFTVNGYTPIDNCFASQISYVARKDNAGIKTLNSFIQTGGTATFPTIVQSVHQRSNSAISMQLGNAVSVGNLLVIIGVGASAQIPSNVTGFTTVLSNQNTQNGVGGFIAYQSITSTANNVYTQSGLSNYMNYILMEVSNCTSVIGNLVTPSYINNQLSSIVQMPFDSYFYGIFGIAGATSWSTANTTIDYDFQQNGTQPGNFGAVAVKSSYTTPALTVNVLPDSPVTEQTLISMLLIGNVNGGTFEAGASNNLSASYVQYRDVYPTDASGNAWTINSLNDLVIGINVVQ